MIGKTFGRYQIVEKLGQGGMGEVWLAHDSSLDRRVALKFLPPVLERDPTARKRFVREARSAAALDHPYICTIHEVSEVDGKVYIAMEHVQGETLKQTLARERLPIARVLEIASEMVQGLTRAHAEGIVHRDLKPANIMLTSDGHVKVMDFGLAKRVSEDAAPQGDSATGVTEQGTTLGTLAYMSPEQLRGGSVDARSDIFSVGLVLYEMLTDKNPFIRGTEIETASAILSHTAPSISSCRKDIPATLDHIVSRMLSKKVEDRYASILDVSGDLDKCRAGRTVLRRPAVLVSAVIAVALAGVSVFLYARDAARIRWAHNEAVPEIVRLAGEEKYQEAFALAKRAELYIPNDAKLTALWSGIAGKVTIQTDPPGANVFVRDYLGSEDSWEPLGTTPIQDVQTAIGYRRFKIEKEGFVPILRAVGVTPALTFNFKLDASGSTPAEMVRVTGGLVGSNLPTLMGLDAIGAIELDNFLIDRFEVTNKDYKRFVDAGGYEKREFWKHPFIKDGRNFSWEQAMAEFRDKTGRSGPATWELGDYDDGQDDFPVSGVSWYEAAAYADFAGKSLPTVFHWVRAAGTQTGKYVFPLSRFGGDGLRSVTSSSSMSPFGAFDMAGNVREWCLNSHETQRYILGGASTDQNYMFTFAYVLSPFDRSAVNGFRCVKYTDPSKLAPKATGPVELTARDYSKETPVGDDIFQIYKQQFAYDRTELDAKIESKDETNEHWIQEKVTFRAAYADERVIAYVTLPKAGKPPYQTVIHFPGSGAISIPRLEDAPSGLDYIVRSGRVVVSVVYKGTFERNDGISSTWPSMTHRYSDYLIKWVKDFKRTVDYLDTRDDIDMSNLAYLGTSWGGRMGAIIPAVEDRLRVSVLLLGGLAAGRARPEVDQINFISRVKIPVLMLNGKYDALEPVETAQLPMFRMWGTPVADRRHVIYESNGHAVPRNEGIKETLDWLDKYLGSSKGN